MFVLTSLFACGDKDPSTEDPSGTTDTNTGGTNTATNTGTTTTGTPPVDADNDGASVDVDCDDNNAAIHPSATEICDGIDNDCDKNIDDDDLDVDTSTGEVFWADVDGDGYGDPKASVMSCDQPDDHVTDDQDCDDTNGAVNPAAAEICNNIDDNCDLLTDDDDTTVDSKTMTSWYLDDDGDGYGAGTASIACAAPTPSWVNDNTDCDDIETTVNPGASEVCNNIDDDCDEAIDDADKSLDPATRYSWYVDGDGDAYGSGTPVVSCADPSSTLSYVLDGGDCDDSDTTLNPGMEELCNGGIDDDCNAKTTEAGTALWDNGTTQTSMTSTLGSKKGSQWISSEAGTLNLCEGTWEARLYLQHDVIVQGHPGTGDVILDGGGGGTVVKVSAWHGNIELNNLVIEGGYGNTMLPSSREVGGGIACEGANLLVQNTSVSNNDGLYGGGIGMWECVAHFVDSEIADNDVANSGGGVWLEASTLRLERTDVANNSAGGYGGGVYATANLKTAIMRSELEIADESFVRDNDAVYGSGLWIKDETTVWCDGTTADAGITNNTSSAASTWAATHFSGSNSEFTANTCDFSGNSPYDLNYATATSNRGLDATFVCTGSTCL